MFRGGILTVKLQESYGKSTVLFGKHNLQYNSGSCLIAPLLL